MAMKNFLDRFRREDEIVSDVVDLEETGGEELKEEQPVRERTPISPGTISLLVFIAVVLIGGIIALAGVYLFRPSEAAVAQVEIVPPDYTIKTAREAYPAAVEAIRAEDAGAKMASAVALWTPGTAAINLESGRSGWTFHFYMPDTGEMATVIVNQDGYTQIESQTAWETTPPLLDDNRWQIDSPTVMSLFLDNCSEQMADAADGVVEARLSAASSNRQLMWVVTMTSESNPEAACAISVDALTGLVR